MGLGHVGRQIYGLALAQPDCEVVAVSDIGQPGILHHLLAKTLPKGTSVGLVGNYLEGKVDGKADPGCPDPPDGGGTARGDSLGPAWRRPS